MQNVGFLKSFTISRIGDNIDGNTKPAITTTKKHETTPSSVTTTTASSITTIFASSIAKKTAVTEIVKAIGKEESASARV